MTTANRAQWVAVDRYVRDLCVPAGAAQETALHVADAAGLSAINVSANEGELICLLARLANLRRILFIDVAKDSCPGYLDAAPKLAQPGTLILAENDICRVTAPPTTVSHGVRERNRQLATNPARECILIPILREQTDRIAIARVEQ